MRTLYLINTLPYDTVESNVLRSPNSIVKYRESKSALVVNKLTSPMEEMLSDLLETLIEDDSANVKKKNKDDRERVFTIIL